MNFILHFVSAQNSFQISFTLFHSRFILKQTAHILLNIYEGAPMSITILNVSNNDRNHLICVLHCATKQLCMVSSMGFYGFGDGNVVGDSTFPSICIAELIAVKIVSSQFSNLIHLVSILCNKFNVLHYCGRFLGLSRVRFVGNRSPQNIVCTIQMTTRE